MDNTNRLPDVMSQDTSSLADIVKKDDFVVINNRVEIKRDLALKLFALSKLSYNVELLPARLIGEDMVYYTKAKVFLDSTRVIESLGSCSTKEIDCKNGREHHDAIARAETRAFKRVLEAAVGLPFINQIIERVFGYQPCGSNGRKPYSKGFKAKSGNGNGRIEPGSFVRKIYEANTITHINTLFDDNRDSFDSYPDKVKDAVFDAKKRKIAQLRTGNDFVGNIDDGIDFEEERREAERFEEE
ncbi:MAG: hypothetical protein SCARUB_01680 [Candidatus Scalindua rubra]|uniref:Uncharacterized protein n=1 Tax=Candidatus Scalindua rubra TaxID=1872076 RepID=A0A1E3XC50_9BACT|nr:MAG: hypothetical protein SCARUB_01680 [Candidatus Scalindua rubra]